MASRRTAPFVDAVVDAFLLTKEPKEPATYASYYGVLRGKPHGTKPSKGVPLAPFFQNVRFDKATDGDVARWYAQRVRNAAQDTKARISKQGREFFRFAYEQGYSDHDLGRAIDKQRAGAPRVEWLEWTVVHSLLDAIPEFRYRMASAWLFFTGSRVSEATSARQADVVFRTTTGLYEWHIHDTKTHAPRAVWLPDALTVYIEASRAANAPKPDWPILWDSFGRGFGRVENAAAPITDRTINSALRRACEDIGLTMNVTAHVAKHTYCTNWVNEYGSNPLSLEKLSRQVGTSVEVLRRTYVHLDFTDEDWSAIRGFGRHA